MKASIVYKNLCVEKGKHKYIHEFIKFLNKNYPLERDVTITFLPKRIGLMSTGSRNQKSEINVLAKGRILRDILRTLSHEWVHEYQRTILNRDKGPNIGGKNEDEANAFAGRLVKMFEKEHPDLEEKMYESKTISNRVDLLNEQIILTQKETIKYPEELLQGFNIFD
jgi:hypothetical protein